ncbi:MAG: hypothetical protein RLZZ293_1041 [Pseudomonadota bacterium]|jgi:UDP-N-acetylmuramate dehydrogenase
MLNIQTNLNLQAFNSLHLQSTTANYCRLTSLEQLTVLRKQLPKFAKFMILGGGSNIILPEFYTGLVIHNQLYGRQIDYQDRQYITITAGAGENWDDFISYCLANGAYGLENLSLIPGSVGASPIQNIGAYGVEVKDFIQKVAVYDWHTGEHLQLTNQQCQFSYRNSYLKNNSRYLVTAVTFRLTKQANLITNYADIAEQLAIKSVTPTPQDLRQVIIATRQAKLPDPQQLGNAGSFFHNPIIEQTIVKKLQLSYPNLPVYPIENSSLSKISAGWLIDNLGLKGYRHADLAIYAKQALVIVNYANSTQTELLKFAQYIQEQVLQQYGIDLNIEPIIIT